MLRAGHLFAGDYLVHSGRCYLRYTEVVAVLAFGEHERELRWIVRTIKFATRYRDIPESAIFFDQSVDQTCQVVGRL